MERRKSVTFADSATKRRASARSASTTQRASPRAASPYNKRAATADANRNPPTPGGTETDGAFKFKRRKRPADAGAVAGATGAPELTRTIVTAAAKPPTPPPPTTTTTALALMAPTSDALADSLLPAPTLHGVPSEVLNAALQVCHDLQALGTPAPLAAVRDACLEELQRVGIEAGVDAQLAARERVLRKRMDELIHMQGEWDGLSDEMPPPPMKADNVEISPTVAATLAKLPEAPPLDDHVNQLRLNAALCADQVELTLMEVSSLCARNEETQEALAKSAHLEAFRGYAGISQPRLLIRSLAAH